VSSPHIFGGNPSAISGLLWENPGVCVKNAPEIGKKTNDQSGKASSGYFRLVERFPYGGNTRNIDGIKGNVIVEQGAMDFEKAIR